MVRSEVSERIRPWQQCALGILTVMPGLVMAAPATISGGLESRYSDNARQTAFDEESDLETRVSVGIQHTSDPGQCNSDLGARFGYGYWLDDTFDPETYTNLDFMGDCQLGNNVVWQVTDQLRDVVQDSRVSNTPTNRTRKNVFRTGPLVTFNLGPVDQLFLSAQYENTEYSEPEETDSERYIGSIGWDHFFSSTFTGGFSASVNQAELDTEEEIDRETLNATFSKTWAATSMRGSVGYSQIESSLNNSDRESDAIVGDLILTRDINPTTELTLEASRELTDQTSDFDIRFGDFVFNLEQTSAVEVSAIRLGLGKEFSGGSSLSAAAYANRSEYLDFETEEERSGVSADYRRPITGQLTATLGVGYDFLTYEDDDTEDVLFRANAGIDFQLNRKLSVISRVGHERRDSDITTREFDENWILVGLNYQFL